MENKIKTKNIRRMFKVTSLAMVLGLFFSFPAHVVASEHGSVKSYSKILSEVDGKGAVEEIIIKTDKNSGIKNITGVKINGKDIRQNDNILWWKIRHMTNLPVENVTAVRFQSLVGPPTSIEVTDGKNKFKTVSGITADSFRIKSVRFDENYKNIYIKLKSPTNLEGLVLKVNGIQRSIYTIYSKNPDFFIIKAQLENGSEVRTGDLVHITADLGNQHDEKIVRGFNKFIISSFGLENIPMHLRKSYNFESLEQNGIRFIDRDFTCSDFLGTTKENGISLRKYLRESGSLMIEGEKGWNMSAYLCTTADRQTYASYGHAFDIVQINPYCLHYKKNDDFVREEMGYFKYIDSTLEGDPWIYIPEAFQMRTDEFDSIIDSVSLRYLVMEAVCHGAMGINYFAYLSGTNLRGYNEFGLQAEIKKINGDLKNLSRLLSQSMVVNFYENPRTGNYFTQFICGDEGYLIICRNEKIICNRKNTESPTRLETKESYHISIYKPDNLQTFVVFDPLTMEKVRYEERNGIITITINQHTGHKVIWIKNTRH